MERGEERRGERRIASCRKGCEWTKGEKEEGRRVELRKAKREGLVVSTVAYAVAVLYIRNYSMGMRGIREGRCIGDWGEDWERGTGANAECGERKGGGS